MSQSPRDSEPLTPLIFIQEFTTSGVPEKDALDTEDHNGRTKYPQRIRNEHMNS